jgi:hypothetical protein
MAIWDGIENVVASQKLPFLNVGSYRVSLVKAEEGMGGLTKEPYFRATYRVVEAKGEGATSVGTVACVVFKRDKYGYFLKDIKNLCAAILAVPAHEVTGELITGIVDTDEAIGVEFQIDVTSEAKKNGLGNVTKHRFFAVADGGANAPAPF